MSERPIQAPLDEERGNPTAANQQAGPGPVGRENEDRDATRDPDAPGNPGPSTGGPGGGAGNPGPSTGEEDGGTPTTGSPGPSTGEEDGGTPTTGNPGPSTDAEDRGR